MIVLDTTVLVYAAGAGHPLRDPCRRLIQAVAGGALEATTTAEVVQEFVHVRARRRPRDDAVELGVAYAELLAPLVTVTAEELRAGLRLYRETPEIGAFDAVLAAAAMSLNAAAVVSADRGFNAVRGLTHVVPDPESVERLVGPPA